jgi:hypothetical protein
MQLVPEEKPRCASARGLYLLGECFSHFDCYSSRLPSASPVDGLAARSFKHFRRCNLLRRLSPGFNRAQGTRLMCSVSRCAGAVCLEAGFQLRDLAPGDMPRFLAGVSVDSECQRLSQTVSVATGDGDKRGLPILCFAVRAESDGERWPGFAHLDSFRKRDVAQ